MFLPSLLFVSLLYEFTNSADITLLWDSSLWVEVQLWSDFDLNSGRIIIQQLLHVAFLFTLESRPLTYMKALHIMICLYWLHLHRYLCFFFVIIPHSEKRLFITADWELVSGGVFNQSGSVFYRISPDNSLLEIQLGKLPTWLPVCYERWNSSLGTLVCRQLGYLRYWISQLTDIAMTPPQLITYIKFSEDWCLNMQIMHYLVKCAFICIHSLSRNWTLDETRFRILHWHIRGSSFYWGNFGYLFSSLHISQNTLNCHKKIISPCF